jgi:hypothetical protein
MGSAAELDANFSPVWGFEVLQEILDRHSHTDNTDRIRVSLAKDRTDAENFARVPQSHIACIDGGVLTSDRQHRLIVHDGPTEYSRWRYPQSSATRHP